MSGLEVRTHPEGGETVHGDEVPAGSVELVIGDPDEYPEADER